MEERIRILLAEDVQEDLEMILDNLKTSGFSFDYLHVEVENDFIKGLTEFKPDIVLSDFTLPNFDGLSAIKLTKEISPSTPIIIVTGSINEEVAVECIKQGADDYIIKENLTRLGFAIKATFETKRLRETKEKTLINLYDSERRLSLALESAKMGTWEIDFTIDNYKHSQRYDKVFGYDYLPEWGYKTFLQHVIPEEREYVEKKHTEAYINGHLYFECRIIKPSNSINWIEVNGNVIYNEVHKPVKMIGVVSDITDRKKSIEQLHYAAILLSNVNDAIVATDSQHRLTAWNAAAESLYGWKAEEVLGKLELEILRTEWPDVDVEKMKRTIAETDHWRGEATQACKDGTRIFVELSSITLYNESGEINGRVSVNHDITERKKAERELRESFTKLEQNKHAILNLMKDLMVENEVRRHAEESLRESETHFRTLADSGQALVWSSGIDKKCNYFNQPWLTFTGRTLEQEIGDGWTENIHPDDLQHCLEIFNSAFDQREKFSMEYRIRHASSEYRWIQDDGTPRYNSKGEFIGYIGHCLDITERKLAVEEIKKLNEDLEQRVVKRTEQLLAANKELEAFSYSVSHDLRAPLRALDGFAKILLEDHSSSLNAEGSRLFQIITDNAKKMGNLIDDLLSFSRLSRQELKFSKIDMYSIANSVFHDLVSDSAKGKIDFQLLSIPMAYGDPSMVRQVWVNLIGNALKFSSNKPNPVIEVGCKAENSENIYYVKDNGAGFDMKYINKLFGVFQRLHPAKEFEGTGVGLAIVQRIVLRLNGRVWAEGKVNEGATFYFTLPNQLDI